MFNLGQKKCKWDADELEMIHLSVTEMIKMIRVAKLICEDRLEELDLLSLRKGKPRVDLLSVLKTLRG